MDGWMGVVAIAIVVDASRHSHLPKYIAVESTSM